MKLCPVCRKVSHSEYDECAHLNKLGAGEKWRGREDYHEDRLSLAREIREVLWSRGHYCPNTAGPDLITHIAIAIESKKGDASPI